MVAKRRITGLLCALIAMVLIGSACTQLGQTAQEKGKQQLGERSKAEEQKAKEDEPPRRGCPACHMRVSPDKDYTLIAEAQSRSKAKGATHPANDLNGRKMDENTKADVCLQCHKPGANERGAAAPLSLRTIAHPSHMNSEHFTENYQGNCFTCHEVDSQGRFLLLTEKVDVNEKGLPKAVPIKGAIPPSEGT